MADFYGFGVTSRTTCVTEHVDVFCFRFLEFKFLLGHLSDLYHLIDVVELDTDLRGSLELLNRKEIK